MVTTYSLKVVTSIIVDITAFTKVLYIKVTTVTTFRI